MFIPPSHRRACSAGSRSASMVAGAIAVMLAVGLRANRGLHVSTPWISIAIAGIVIAVVLVRVFRWLNSPEASDEPSAPPTSAEATADERQRWLVILALIVAALLAIGLFVALTPRAAASQETRAAPAAVTQSAYLLTKGTDTIVVERVTRTASQITGDITMRGQARMTFVADLGASPTVPMMSFKAWGAGASLDAPPLQSGTQVMTRDTAVATSTAAAAASAQRR